MTIDDKNNFNRLWLILATLTFARMTMGFQFQSIATLGPSLTSDATITYTQLGALIGIYLLPGAFFAIPGGWLGKRFGDKRVVLTGLTMMTLGGALLSLSDVYAIMFAGRLVTGIGAVLLNVLVTKMVTDWFAEYRIATAMGILVSSWPLGIAIALLTMGPIASLIGIRLAFLLPVAVCTIALLLIAMIYSCPPETEGAVSPASQSTRVKLSAYEFRTVLLSGCVWCLYNVALILPLSFGPQFLADKGLTLASAGAVVSLTTWFIIPALPLGAWVAERINRPFATMIVSFILIAILICFIPFTSSYILSFAALGIIFGPAGGLVMALPTQVLQKENRAIGMGIFFTIYYGGMGIIPAVAGYAIEISGNPAAPFFLGAVAIALAILALSCFHFLQIRQARELSSKVMTESDLFQ